MNHEFALAIITAVLSSTGGVGLLQWVLTSKAKKAQDERDRKEKEAEQRRDKQAETSQTWYRESRNHYEIAKEEAAEAKKECSDCMKELRATRQVIYRLLEEFEDKVIPMLDLPEVTAPEIRVTMRATIKSAREAL